MRSRTLWTLPFQRLVVKRDRDIAEFRVRWAGSCEDSWHEPVDFENAQDTLVSYLQKLTKADRIKVLLRAFDAKSFALLPASLRLQLK
jgi:hypothetical protein